MRINRLVWEIYGLSVMVEATCDLTGISRASFDALLETAAYYKSKLSFPLASDCIPSESSINEVSTGKEGDEFPPFQYAINTH